MKVKLGRDWEIGAQIGNGGFGNVYDAQSGDVKAVAKLVPKAHGADRELLFVDLNEARNVVPILESGETDTHWVIIMPKAEKSLHEHLLDAGGSLGIPQVLSILTDLIEALIDLNGKVVHRDIKPKNILLLDGKWCLADFGISRYAEATTAPDTQKYALSAPYAAPERWSGIRATAATDIYSIGVVAYEMIAGRRPFEGPEFEDYREQHLHEAPTIPGGLSPSLFSLILRCLYKPSQARPSATEVLGRLQHLMTSSATSSALIRLQEANQQATLRSLAEKAAAARERSEQERRKELAAIAREELNQIAATLKQTILDSATEASDLGDGILLSTAKLVFGQFEMCPPNWGGDNKPPVFDVIAHTYISLEHSTDYAGYEGRSHSLWYCDAMEAGTYRWYETAFMTSPFYRYRNGGRQKFAQQPFALPPRIETSLPLQGVVSDFQVAWPFTPIDLGDLDEFTDRWVEWFALAALGDLHIPRRMPERNPAGSWRQK